MDIYEEIEVNLEDCPDCGGSGLLEEENHNSFYVSCMECGSATVHIDYKNSGERLASAKRAVELWNLGKVISSSPGE